jgi:hypothetical protein
VVVLVDRSLEVSGSESKGERKNWTKVDKAIKENEGGSVDKQSQFEYSSDKKCKTLR